MTSPLDGIVVADFSRVLAGPLATSMLADLGATVVKVERPGVGDDTRHWGPPWTTESSSYFESANRSKMSIELDLNDPLDLAVARDLAESADVLVENHRHGKLAAVGLGYADLIARNPRLVYCSVSGFGSKEGAGLPGYDFLVQAVGGLMSITGEADADPSKVGVALVDVLTGKDAVIGILAALTARTTTGRGQLVEVNLLSSLLGSLANQASAFLSTGIAPKRLGNRHPSIAPYEALACHDGLLAVCCGNDAQFVRLTEVLNVGDLARDTRFCTNAARVQNRDALAELLERELQRESVDVWSARFTAVGVPAGKIADIGSALDLAQSLGLDPLVDVGEGHIRQIRHPISYSDSTLAPYGPPPGLGQHNHAVRRLLEGTAASSRSAASAPTTGPDESSPH